MDASVDQASSGGGFGGAPKQFSEYDNQRGTRQSEQAQFELAFDQHQFLCMMQVREPFHHLGIGDDHLVVLFRRELENLIAVEIEQALKTDDDGLKRLLICAGFAFEGNPCEQPSHLVDDTENVVAA